MVEIFLNFFYTVFNLFIDQYVTFEIMAANISVLNLGIIQQRRNKEIVLKNLHIFPILWICF